MHNREHKNWNNFVLGLLVAIVPFLGVPLALKEIFLVITGLLIALFSLATLDRPQQ